MIKFFIALFCAGLASPTWAQTIKISNAKVTSSGTPATTKPLKDWAAEIVTHDAQLAGAVGTSVGAGLVTATGSTTARSLAARFADVVNVRDFGAVGDGVTDDTAAVQACINSGKECVAPKPASCYKLTASVTIGNGQKLRGLGSRPQFKAFFNGPAFTMSEKGWLENVSTDADVAYRGIYTGVLVDAGVSPGAATQGNIRDVFVFYPGTGLWFRGGAYWWDVDGITVYKFKDYGLLLDNRNGTGMSPNNNVFRIKELTGDVPLLGGVEDWTQILWEQAAIKVDHGTANTFLGGENAPALYGVIVTGGAVNNWFKGQYGEHQKYALKADAGTFNFWDSHSWIQSPAQIDPTAKVIGPSGLLVAPYNNWFQPTVQAANGLKALYFFNEGAGDVVIDHSGNGRHLKHNAGASPVWTTNGRWGSGLRFDAQNGNYLDETPLVSAVDWTQPFTLAMLVRYEGTWNGDIAFTLRDSAQRYTRVTRDGVSNYAAVQDNDTATLDTRARTTMNPAQTPDAWSWLFIYFDPVNHKATMLDPFGGEGDLVGTGAQDGLTNVRFSPLAANGGAGVSVVGLMRHPGFTQAMKGTVSFLGLWQRKLAWTEAFDLSNMKVPTLFPDRESRTVKSLAFARDGATTEARMSYGTSAPSSCTRVGDVVWNAAPTSPSPGGWRCTVVGTPGTWETLPGRGTSQADSAAGDVATLKTDFNALLAKLRAAGILAP